MEEDNSECDKNQSMGIQPIKENQGPGNSGYIYGQSLALYILLKTINACSTDFLFAQEHKYAKNFDDIVLNRAKTEKTRTVPFRLMQLKYKENVDKKFDKKMLLKSYDVFKQFLAFSDIKLEKYFDNVETGEFMLITNNDFDSELGECWEQTVSQNDIHFDENNAMKIYKFKFDSDIAIVKEIILEIKTSLLIQVLQNVKLADASELKVNENIISSIFQSDTKGDKKYAKISESFLETYKPSAPNIKKLKVHFKKHKSVEKALKEEQFELGEAVASILQRSNKEKPSIDEQLKEFFGQFYVVITPDYEFFYELIKIELHKLVASDFFDADIVQYALKMKMFHLTFEEDRIFKDRHYWVDKINNFINTCAKMVLDQNVAEIKTECDRISFKHDELFDTFPLENIVLNIVTPITSQITKLKVYSLLNEDLKKITIFEEFGKNSDLIIKGFSLSSCKLLVLYQNENVNNNLLDKVVSMVAKDVQKSVIIITKEKLAVKSEFEYLYKFIFKENSLVDFTEDMKFLGNLIIHGKKIDFPTLSFNVKRSIKDESILKLLDGQNIIIAANAFEQNVRSTFLKRSIFMFRSILDNDKPLLNFPDHEDLEDGEILEKIKNANQLITVQLSSLPPNDTIYFSDNENIIVITNEKRVFLKELYTYGTTQMVHWFYKYDDTHVWLYSNKMNEDMFEFINGVRVKVDSVNTLKEPIVVLAAKAGMGKSTLLENVAFESNSNSVDDWVVLIKLGSFSEHFDRWVRSKLAITESVAMNFIKQATLNGEELEKIFFDQYYQTKKVTLLVDAYDEITPTYTEKVLELLKVLSEMNFKSLWITTRPYNILEPLENMFGVKAYNLVPFNGDMRKIFFDIHLRKGRKSVFNQVYFETLLSTVEHYLGGDILGLPLHCKMIFEIVEKNFPGLYDTNIIFDNESKQRLMKLTNIYTLYEIFVEKKFHMHFVEKLKMEMYNPLGKRIIAEAKKTFINKCQKFAIQSLLTAEQINELEIKLDDTKEIEDGDEVGGFIENVKQGKPQFLHQTYAEYFVAKFIIGKVMEDKANGYKILLKFYFCDDYLGVKSFIDEMLFEFNEGFNCEVHRSIKNDPTDFAIEKISSSSELELNSKDVFGRTPLIIAVFYNKSCVKDLLKRSVDTSIVDLYNFTAFKYAVKLANLLVINILLATCNYNEIEFLINDENNLMCLIYGCKDPNILRLFLKKIHKKCNKKDKKKFVMLLVKYLNSAGSQTVMQTVNILIFLFKCTTKYKFKRFIYFPYDEIEIYFSSCYSLKKTITHVRKLTYSYKPELLDPEKLYFAEYCVADWLIKKINNSTSRVKRIVRNVIFMQKHKYIAAFFKEMCTCFKKRRLHYLIKQDKLSEAENYLTAEGKDEINYCDSIGRTSLMLAVLYCPKVVSNLLHCGADPDAIDKIDYTALKYAIKIQEWASAEYILCYQPSKKGIEVFLNEQDERNLMDLINAAIQHDLVLLLECFLRALKRNRNYRLIDALVESFVGDILHFDKREKRVYVAIARSASVLFNRKQIVRTIDAMVVEDVAIDGFERLNSDLKYSSLDLIIPGINDIDQIAQNKLTFVNDIFGILLAANYLVEMMKCGDSRAIQFIMSVMFDERHGFFRMAVDTLSTFDNHDTQLNYTVLILPKKYVKVCLEKIDKEYVNNVDIFLRTPLMLAASHGLNIIEDLLDNDADAEAITDCFGYTALKYAVKNNNWYYVDMILARRQNSDFEIDEVIDCENEDEILAMLNNVIEFECVIFIKIFLKKTVNKKVSDALIKAIYQILTNFSGDEYMFTIFMRSGLSLFDLNHQRMLLDAILEEKCELYKTDNIEHMFRNLEYSSMASIFDNTQFDENKFTNSDRVCCKLNKKIFVDYFAANYIVREINRGNRDIINLYYSIYCEMKYRSVVKFVDTLLTYDLEELELHNNIIMVHSKYVRTYLQNKTTENINNVDPLGRTPLMIAACYDYPIIEVLLEHGAKLDTKDRSGLTALDYAIKVKQLEAIDLLLL